MLFNSPIFIFVFLPITWLGFVLLGLLSVPRARYFWLSGASLFFYGWYRAEHLWLLLASILFNYALGRWLSVIRSGRGRLVLLWTGLASNLGALAYYKYAGFMVQNLASLLGTDWNRVSQVLPLAISFFTFLQIAYLVDAYRGLTREYGLMEYLLFVTFFPHLIAGPLVHHSELVPQFGRQRGALLKARDLAAGLSLFVLGLAKKVLIADQVAPLATPVFAAAGAEQVITFVDAWGGALAYTFQLYFDFSGYSDMALGLSLLFGVRLPINFDSPYKAVNLIEFWRRWHMTLSRFLRDYLYFALGGNRKGPARRYLNLMLTMVLGGLWHGAGWTFIVWGGLHGAGLAINHAWHSIRERVDGAGVLRSQPGIWACRAITFLFVVITWVFFRAPTIDSAWRMVRAMVGFDGFSMQASFTSRRILIGWVICLLVVVWLMPNSQEWLGRARAALWSPRPAGGPSPELLRRIGWGPSPFWAVTLGALFVIVVLNLSRVSEFIYYQF